MERIQADPPDLVATEITLTGASGLELISLLQSSMPNLPILVVSMHDEALYAWRCFRLGARGYVVKQHAADVVLTAIRKVLQGGVYISENLTETIISHLQGRSANLAADPIDSLTERELEVFALSGHGLTSREISDIMHVSTKTVDSHRANVRSKLRLSSNEELIQYSVKWAQGKTAK